jgi:hypothetical protein
LVTLASTSGFTWEFRFSPVSRVKEKKWERKVRTGNVKKILLPSLQISARKMSNSLSQRRSSAPRERAECLCVVGGRGEEEEEEEEDEEVRRGVYGRSYKVPASVVRGAFLETAILIKHRYAVRDSAYSLEREARGH